MASGNTFDAAFGVDTLDSMVRTFDTSKHDTFFSDLFRKSSLTPQGDTVRWDEMRFDRGLAPVTGPESPAPKVKNMDRVVRTANLASVKLYTDISGHRIFKERGPGGLTPNAEEVIAAEVKNLRIQVQKTINYFAVQLLLGGLTINSTNIPGSDITTPAIAVGVSTYTKSASWSLAGTGILSSELKAFVASPTVGYVGKAGRLPGLAICNDSVEGYLTANTEVQNWLKQQYGSAAGFTNPASDEFFGSLMIGGLKWMKNVHGYVLNGTFTKYMPDGQVILLPPPDELGEVLTMAEGYGHIPRSAFGSENANGIVELAPSAGFYAYATAIDNPAGVRVFVGWYGLPCVKFPAAVDVGTVL